MHEPVHDVIVIGGGISGLSAAWQLNNTNVDVCLLEAKDKVGGCARSEQRDGFLLEKGPFNVIVRDPAFERLLEDMSRDVTIVSADPAAHARYIYRRGRLHAVPTNPIALATTGLLTTSGKIRLIAGLLASRRAGQLEETIGQAAMRRFGTDVSDTMISAVIVGIVAGDIRRLSLKACFPSVHRVDAQARSLFGYGLASMRNRKPRPRWRGLVSIDGGLGALTGAIGARLGTNLLRGCRVTEIRRTASDGPWCVDYLDHQREKQTRRALDVLIAGPISEAGRLLQPMLPAATAILDTIESASMVVLNLGFRRVDVGHPLRGYGFLVPHNEPDLPILGSLWADSIFPHHAPSDRRLIRVFLGGSRDPGVVERSDDDLLAMAMRSIGSLLSIKGDPVLTDVCRYKSAIPQYHIGHLDKIERLQAAVATLSGLHLVGNYLEGVSINDCVRLGVKVAMKIVRHRPSHSEFGLVSLPSRPPRRMRERTTEVRHGPPRRPPNCNATCDDARWGKHEGDPPMTSTPRKEAPRRRPRRLRRSDTIRALVRETRLTPDRLVLPQFIIEGHDRSEPIDAMPGRSRQTVDLTIAECTMAMELGVRSFALFTAVDPSRKTNDGREAVNPENLTCRAVRAIKAACPEACVITDIALDPYSNVGHDGIVSDSGVVLNDETVDLLAKMAVVQAEAGADMVAPSDMMDGRVAAIRTALDEAGWTDTAILSYTAKYASAFYGPFRQALESAPVDLPNVPRDKKTYQMDPANAREAIIEAMLDEAEGADILMVKPALPYLDIIASLRARTSLPIAAYHVSGEYAMIKAAALNGWLDERECMTESLTSIARAGADLIFTYAALDFARWHR